MEVLRDFHQAIRVGAIRRTNHQHQVCVVCNVLHRNLPVFSRITNVLRMRTDDIGKLVFERLNHVACLIEREGGLGQVGDPVGIGNNEISNLLHGRDDLSHVGRLALGEFLEPTTSYLSVVEIGLYEATVKLHAELAEKGIKPHSPEWVKAIKDDLEDQRLKLGARLWPQVPDRRYVCFYPMNKRRSGSDNWYSLPIEERQLLMRDHGMIGRRYAGQVTQVISGSIGFDDWEWGVDLFADDPLVFKKLVYEMRFDESSARYAEFGPFYFGIRLAPAEIERILGTPADR